MAGGARNGSAFAMIHWEGMLSIERGGLPGIRAVTGCAVCAKLTCVCGGFGMTGNTAPIQSLELIILVATLTSHLHMYARQREVAFAVIKCRVVPFIRRMAGRAIRAELTVVLIVLLMAGIAIRWRPFEYIIDMTLIAFYADMFAFQLEGRKVVIKSGFLPIR